MMGRDAGAAPIRDEPRQDWRHGGFGVYVHWPFCQAKCPYCDFNSHVRAEIDQQRWSAALAAELAAMRQRTGPRRVDTVFFGGGTPSLMAAETVATLIERIDALWGLAEGAEITLEANPTSVEAGRFRAYAAAGVNRVSMGIQALNDRDLKALGRLHSADEARRAFDIARGAFARVSFDLIYARMGQSLADWERELSQAIAMAVEHLSLYQLTIEPQTRFAELYARGKLSLPDDDAASEMYRLTQEICAAAGMGAYEVSNHAAPGAESRHNLVYWRYGDYAGVGPGAHGRLTLAERRVATETLSAPEAWLAQVEAQGDGLTAATPVSRRAQSEEMLMMGLRLTEGVRQDRYAALAGAPFDEARLQPLVADGLLTRTGDVVSATPAGRLVLNAVLRALLV